MYHSFEGNPRTRPDVSLGGSRRERGSGSEVVQRARMERQKRESARKELQSSIILQSSIRSFLVRKKIKAKFREKFDDEKQQLLKDSRLLDVTRLLCFFFESGVPSDAERLVWLCQNLLKGASKATDWPSSSYLLSQVLVLCCRDLARAEHKQAATHLRMFENFTSSNFWGILNDSEKHKEALKSQLLLWERLVHNGFYRIMMLIFVKRVPLEIELPDEEESYGGGTSRYSPPHLILAQSLLNILKQPLNFIGRANVHAPSLSDTLRKRVSTATDLMLERFSLEVLSHHVNIQNYNYILPCLKKDEDFPRNLLLRHLTVALVQTGSSVRLFPSVFLLASFVKLYDNFTERNSDDVLVCLRWLISALPRVRHLAVSDSDSDEEGYGAADVIMEESTQEVSFSEVLSTTFEFVNSSRFIEHCVKRRHYDDGVVRALCEIAYHFMTELHYTIHTTRILYTLAFSTKFLKKVWESILTLKTSKTNSMQSQSSIQAILSGSHMSSRSVKDFDVQLATFSSLFSHNLLSLHDVDFYQTELSANSRSTFTLAEMTTIVRTLRDVSLRLIRTIFPEWKTPHYDVRELYHQLSSGKPLTTTTCIQSSSGLTIATAAHLFKVCSRLLNQLHTRHTRRPFGGDDIWLSTVVGNENQKYLIANWRRRHTPKDNLAAHMADPSDEDLTMSIAEAKQLLTLTCLPFTVPFTNRVSIFTSMLTQDRSSRVSARDALFHDAGLADSSTVIRVTVRRDYIYEDAFNDFSLTNAPDLRRVLRVTFVNPAGMEEAGYGEGVTREFMQQLAKTAFEPTRGLFIVTGESGLYPNPHADRVMDNFTQHFNFLGRILGKLLYEGMQTEMRFASFFLCKLLRHKNVDVDINHLQSLDPDFYKNLMFLRRYEGDVADLDLNFTVVDDQFGELKVKELVPGGQDMAVNNDNRVRYIHLLANYKLNVQMKPACDAFRNGMASVVPLEWLRMFDHRELQTLLSGAEVEIDVIDMRRHTTYSGGYKEDDATITLFWEVLATFSEEEKRKLLLFVTSCSRPPFLGFKEMHPPFCVHNGGESDRLPTSSTCLNLLRLPRYTDSQTMKEKILYCIESGSGFELS